MHFYAFSDTIPKMKMVFNKSKITIPICKNCAKNCIGYSVSSDEFGFLYSANGALLEQDSLITIDTDKSALIKINLQNGDIVKKSKKINDIMIYSVLLKYCSYYLIVGLTSSDIIVVDMEFNYIQTIKIPWVGASTYLRFLNDDLYIIKDQFSLFNLKSDDMTLGYKLSKELIISEDTVQDMHSDTCVYGQVIHYSAKELFISFDNAIYKLDEVIPTYVWDYKTIALNDRYLVYIDLKGSCYQLVVYRYR